jgi:hypothetical protein
VIEWRLVWTTARDGEGCAVSSHLLASCIVIFSCYPRRCIIGVEPTCGRAAKKITRRSQVHQTGETLGGSFRVDAGMRGAYQGKHGPGWPSRPAWLLAVTLIFTVRTPATCCPPPANPMHGSCMQQKSSCGEKSHARVDTREYDNFVSQRTLTARSSTP